MLFLKSTSMALTCQDSEELSTSFLLTKAFERGRNVKGLWLFWWCNMNLFSNTEFQPNELIC